MDAVSLGKRFEVLKMTFGEAKTALKNDYVVTVGSRLDAEMCHIRTLFQTGAIVKFDSGYTAYIPLQKLIAYVEWPL